MKTIILISRYLLAAVFLFSGFVKGVDPLGTAYKIDDYLLAYQMDWALSLSLVISFGLIALELSLGVMLLFNLLPKFTRLTMTVLMIFFTIVTFYDALYNPVSDCGCFGDALVLTNWQTFYKNIIIDIFIVGLFLIPLVKINLRKHLGWSLGFYIVFLGFTYYNLQHLPIIDFRFWKIGSQVFDNNQKTVELYLTYQNKTSGETKEFLSPNFPYQDSLWLSKWKFVSMREYNPNTSVQTMIIFDLDGNDITKEILGFPGKILLLISNNLDAITPKQTSKIKELLQLVDNEALPIFLITASVGEKINDFVNNNQIDISVFLADDIDLKTIIRSNPGLVLLENGRVINKWAYTDFPSSSNQIFD